MTLLNQHASGHHDYNNLGWWHNNLANLELENVEKVEKVEILTDSERQALINNTIKLVKNSNENEKLIIDLCQKYPAFSTLFKEYQALETIAKAKEGSDTTKIAEALIILFHSQNSIFKQTAQSQIRDIITSNQNYPLIIELGKDLEIGKIITEVTIQSTPRRYSV